MKKPNPFIIPASPQERVNQARNRLKVSVLIVSGVSAVSLTLLLMLQGCGGPANKTPDTYATDTNPVVTPAFTEPTNTPTPAPTSAPPESVVTPVPTPIPTPVVPPSTAPPELAAGMRQHAVEKGDSFYTLAKKYGTTIKAIEAANPGVDSRKLKLNQKLNIPAATTTEAGSTSGAASNATPESGGTTYTVKSGDNLTRIAKRFGVSVSALRTANHLQTDRLTVGKKLTIPAKAGAASAAAPTPPPVTTPEPMPSTPAPVVPPSTSSVPEIR